MDKQNDMAQLRYLARRLASFDVDEAAQFQAMVHKLELFELKDQPDLLLSSGHRHHGLHQFGGHWP